MMNDWMSKCVEKSRKDTSELIADYLTKPDTLSLDETNEILTSLSLNSVLHLPVK